MLNDIPTSMTEAEATRLAELAAGRRVLEVGSWLGHSTVAMALRGAVVHAVDWHRGDPHAGDEETAARFLDNLARFGVADTVVAHVGRSEIVLPALRPMFFDFAFHDAYHEADAVEADVLMMLPLLTGTGRLALHDYGLFGVAEAVSRLPVEIVELTGTLLVVERR